MVLHPTEATILINNQQRPGGETSEMGAFNASGIHVSPEPPIRHPRVLVRDTASVWNRGLGHHWKRDIGERGTDA